jgi:hypothetical protein
MALPEKRNCGPLPLALLRRLLKVVLAAAAAAAEAACDGDGAVFGLWVAALLVAFLALDDDDEGDEAPLLCDRGLIGPLLAALVFRAPLVTLASCLASARSGFHATGSPFPGW